MRIGALRATQSRCSLGSLMVMASTGQAAPNLPKTRCGDTSPEQVLTACLECAGLFEVRKGLTSMIGPDNTPPHLRTGAEQSFGQPSLCNKPGGSFQIGYDAVQQSATSQFHRRFSERHYSHYLLDPGTHAACCQCWRL